MVISGLDFIQHIVTSDIVINELNESQAMASKVEQLKEHQKERNRVAEVLQSNKLSD